MPAAFRRALVASRSLGLMAGQRFEQVVPVR